VQAAEQWRLYQLSLVGQMCEAERKQADDEFESDNLNVKEELMQLLQERQKKLEEEKNTLNLAEPGAEADRLPNPRSLRRRGGGKEALQTERERIKKKPTLPPHINYALKDTEIQDDMAAIAKAFVAAGRDTRSKLNEIFTDKGIFHYYEREFEKGSSISVQAAKDPDKKENEAWSGVISLVNPQEIQLKTNDGARQRITLAQFRSGKYVCV